MLKIRSVLFALAVCAAAEPSVLASNVFASALVSRETTGTFLSGDPTVMSSALVDWRFDTPAFYSWTLQAESFRLPGNDAAGLHVYLCDGALGFDVALESSAPELLQLNPESCPVRGCPSRRLASYPFRNRAYLRSRPHRRRVV